MRIRARRRPAGFLAGPGHGAAGCPHLCRAGQWEGNIAAPRRTDSAVRGTSEVDGFHVACGAGLPADTPGEPDGSAMGEQEHLGGTEDRRRGTSRGRDEGTGWLPGDFRQADLVTKVDGALAAYHLRWARPGPSCVKQARDAAPHMPVRELGGIRPPVRDLVVSALLPGYGFRLHRAPLEDLGIGVGSAAYAADPRFNDILPGGPGGGEWADCTAMVTEVCAPHKVAS